MVEVAILDYGVGNLFSLVCGLRRAGVESKIYTASDLPRTISALILPGVGSFDEAVRNIGLHREKIGSMARSGTPLLGICLGMQLYFERSEEGKEKGLGMMKGGVVRLPEQVKVPHMGWNTIKLVKDDELVEGLKDGAYVYFVHSYYPSPSKDIVLAETDYGVCFPSILAQGNIFGTQFHPEKSGETGKRILENFVRIVRR